jgi:hypothetical protein
LSGLASGADGWAQLPPAAAQSHLGGPSQVPSQSPVRVTGARRPATLILAAKPRPARRRQAIGGARGPVASSIYVPTTAKGRPGERTTRGPRIPLTCRSEFSWAERCPRDVISRGRLLS